MNRWKAILAVTVIFAAGFGSGVLATNLYRQPQRPARKQSAVALPPWTVERMDFMRRWAGRLDLKPEQHARIDALVNESQQRVRGWWRPLVPQVQEELKLLRRRIEAELSPEQRARFESLAKERPARVPTEGRRRKDGSPGQPSELTAPAP